MEPGKTYYRNEVYSKSQKAVEKLLELMGKLDIRGIPTYWMDCQGLAHGFTHRVKGINAFVEETPDEQRCQITKSNSRS